MCIRGCRMWSAKAGGSKDETILNGKTSKITESSEELPRVFPIMTAQSFMEGEEFEDQSESPLFHPTLHLGFGGEAKIFCLCHHGRGFG